MGERQYGQLQRDILALCERLHEVLDSDYLTVKQIYTNRGDSLADVRIDPLRMTLERLVKYGFLDKIPASETHGPALGYQVYMSVEGYDILKNTKTGS